MTTTRPYTPETPIWQIGTGDGTRGYFDLFQKYGIAALGWGHLGEWGKTPAALPHQVRRFVEDVQDGDLIVARAGSRTLLDVGVVGPWRFSEQLSAIQGWDLANVHHPAAA